MPSVSQNEDGKLEVDGVVFHRDTWDDGRPNPVNPFYGLDDIKNKHDMGSKFGKFAMDYRYPKKEMSYDEEILFQKEFCEGLGFVQKDSNQWPYTKWSHKLKVDDLKDLLRQTFENDLKEEIEVYKRTSQELKEYNEDMQNRQVFANQINDFLNFRNAFKIRRTSFKELIESIELSIGKGHYRRLASHKSPHGDYRYIPKEALVNSFEAMAYAKEWLNIFEPVITELNRLEDALKMPYDLKGDYVNIPTDKIESMWLSDLVSFRYQDFLTFLMDFKKRFGKDERWNRDETFLSGWAFPNHDDGGNYRNSSEAAEWDVFNTQKDEYGRGALTWGVWLSELALNGQIEAISDPNRMQDIVNLTNLNRHRHNEKYKLYEKFPTVLVSRMEPKKEVE